MTMVMSLSNLTAYLDNSSAFAEYLRKYGMNDALEKLGLELRQKHRIVPHVRMYPFVVAVFSRSHHSGSVCPWMRSRARCPVSRMSKNGTFT
jgi:hypothetical protein